MTDHLGEVHRPHLRDDRVELIAAAAGGNPASGTVLINRAVDDLGDPRERAHREPEVREGIAVMGVGPQLGEDQVRLERPGQGRDHPVQRPQVVVVPRPRKERHVGARSERVVLTDLILEARTRKEIAPRLVQGHGQHAWLVVEDPLHAVAVMNVDIEIHDPPVRMVGQHLRDRDRRIVVDAETGRLGATGMVQSSRRIERVVEPARSDRICGGQAGPRHRARRRVHVHEDRIVGRTEAVVERLRRRHHAPVESLDDLDVVRRVSGPNLLLGRHARGDLVHVGPVDKVTRPDALVGEEDALRPQWMLRPEVVLPDDVVNRDERRSVRLIVETIRFCVLAASTERGVPRHPHGQSSIWAFCRRPEKSTAIVFHSVKKSTAMGPASRCPLPVFFMPPKGTWISAPIVGALK